MAWVLCWGCVEVTLTCSLPCLTLCLSHLNFSLHSLFSFATCVHHYITLSLLSVSLFHTQTKHQQQALSAPNTGETLVKMLVLDHAKLDASEAAKAGREGGGGGGGGGRGGGLMGGLLGMTAEEVMGAMVAAAVER